ncbi:MAG: DUF2274 domain-containing protein [Nitrospirae bacterium]|nr:DUF2274 domain-containing protein [Nitrospirota bacterium]
MPKVGIIKKVKHLPVTVKLPQETVEEIAAYQEFYKEEATKKGIDEKDASVTKDELLTRIVEMFFESDKDFLKYKQKIQKRQHE